ncbi:MAG TPA: hypothetical protein PK413_15400, partial [Thermoanaerobaculia bacterium]|nr:hypothetical protein [Thermoanaerobaculia bacterium]
FARYSDQRLGAATHRLVNPFDVVPKAWAEATLARLPSLYLPLAPATDFERNAVCFALDVVHGKNYRQIRPDTPPLAGALEPSLTTFAGQAGWQHTCGYRCATGLVPALKPVSRDCRDFHPPDPCPVCPQP